jgi:hypothetical protein
MPRMRPLNVGKIIIAALLIISLPRCLVGDAASADQVENDTAANEENVESGTDKSNGEAHPAKKLNASFMETFLISSEMNTAYENAIDVIYGTGNVQELRHSITNLRRLIANNPEIVLEYIDEFFEALEKYCDDDSQAFDQKTLETAEDFLTTLYKKVADELLNHIGD